MEYEFAITSIVRVGYGWRFCNHSMLMGAIMINQMEERVILETVDFKNKWTPIFHNKIRMETRMHGLQKTVISHTYKNFSKIQTRKEVVLPGYCFRQTIGAMKAEWIMIYPSAIKLMYDSEDVFGGFAKSWEYQVESEHNKLHEQVCLSVGVGDCVTNVRLQLNVWLEMHMQLQHPLTLTPSALISRVSY